jgi:hypothetical protein
MLSAGLYPTVCASHSVEDGINSVRATLPHCYFDEAECSVGLRHLKAYRKDWDEQHGCWKDKPRRDSSTHCADAFRYLSMAWRDVSDEVVGEPTPKEIVKKMIDKQSRRTMADMWSEYVNELRERDDAELPEDYEEFALSKKSTLDME